MDSQERGRPADYLANERTFLAWIRTAITIIGLGFVVVKFGLLTRELSGSLHIKSNHLSNTIGVALVVLGGVLVFAALARQMGAERDIAAGTYRPQGLLTTVLAIAVAATAALLAIYLAVSG